MDASTSGIPPQHIILQKIEFNSKMVLVVLRVKEKAWAGTLHLQEDQSVCRAGYKRQQ